MHIVFISTNHDFSGGSETLWLNAAIQACKSGHRVSIFISKEGEGHGSVKNLLNHGAFVHHWIRGVKIPKWPIRAFKKLFRNKPLESKFWKINLPKDADVFCINQGGPFCATWLDDLSEAVVISKKPYVCLARGNRIAFPITDAWRSSAGIFFSGASFYVGACREVINASERILATRLKGFDLHSPISDFSENCMNWPDESVFRMACVGRLLAIEKGQDLLLNALAAPAWRDRNFQLTFYGSGEDFSYLKKLVIHYGLDGKVFFAGRIPNSSEAWKNNHLAILPSYFEGTPQVMLEAMLCSRPVVATAVGGIPEWLEEGKTGFLAEAPTVHHLRLALERAWENRHRWAEMGEAARAACLAKRDPDPAGSLLKILLGRKIHAIKFGGMP